MNREEALKKLKEEVIPELSFKYLMKTYELCMDIKENVTQKFLDSYLELYEKINTNKKEPVHFINAQILRTGVYSREYDIMISAFNEEFYFDKNPVYVKLNVPEIFKYLDEFEKEIAFKAKSYINKASYVDAIVFKQEVLEKYLHF